MLKKNKVALNPINTTIHYQKSENRTLRIKTKENFTRKSKAGDNEDEQERLEMFHARKLGKTGHESEICSFSRWRMGK